MLTAWTEASWGKTRRLNRLGRVEGTYILLALDHGLSLGPLPGIEDFSICADDELNAVFTGVVLNRGAIGQALSPASRLGMVLQTFGSSSNDAGIRKVRLISPDEAIVLDPDALAVELNLNQDSSGKAISDVADTVTICSRIGMPVLLMLTPKNGEPYINCLAHGIRMATELGVDLLKIGLPAKIVCETAKTVSPLIRAIELAPPVLLAGGPLTGEFMPTVEYSRKLGFRGICVGRNIFQSISIRNSIRAIGDAFAENRQVIQ